MPYPDFVCIITDQIRGLKLKITIADFCFSLMENSGQTEDNKNVKKMTKKI